jgi:hypothetical protein
VIALAIVLHNTQLLLKMTARNANGRIRVEKELQHVLHQKMRCDYQEPEALSVDTAATAIRELLNEVQVVRNEVKELRDEVQELKIAVPAPAVTADAALDEENKCCFRTDHIIELSSIKGDKFVRQVETLQQKCIPDDLGNLRFVIRSAEDPKRPKAFRLTVACK